MKKIFLVLLFIASGNVLAFGLSQELDWVIINELCSRPEVLDKIARTEGLKNYSKIKNLNKAACVRVGPEMKAGSLANVLVHNCSSNCYISIGKLDQRCKKVCSHYKIVLDNTMSVSRAMFLDTQSKVRKVKSECKPIGEASINDEPGIKGNKKTSPSWKSSPTQVSPL